MKRSNRITDIEKIYQNGPVKRPQRPNESSDQVESRDYRFFGQMALIRAFEKKLETLFSEGKLFGTTHVSIGQEAIAVGAINALKENDYVTSTHRGHGHYLTYTDDVEGLMAEIMGLETGVVGGRGGSQHINNGRFFSNGVQGGMVPIGVGLALAEKRKQRGNLVLSIVGDGTLGQGVVYESLNLAALWEAPFILAIENNFYAMSTHVKDAIASDIASIGKSFNIETYEVDGNDVKAIYDLCQNCFQSVRDKPRPLMLVFNTYRQRGHSKNDDCAYRSREEERDWLDRDPIKILTQHLEDSEKLASLAEEANDRVEQAYQQLQ